MSTVTVTRDEIVSRIKNTGGKFFSVTFITRTHRNKRTMICRSGVKKGLSTESKPRNFKPAFHDLIPTFSIDSDGYRHIAIEGIMTAKIGGVRYTVQD